MTHIGADGCPGGWVGVEYSDEEFLGVTFYEDVDALWTANKDAERILIDVPIGLREEWREPRQCDTAAREVLSPRRHRSVFPVPVRDATREETYEAAKAKQEELTDGSLNTQTWGITPKIAEVDRFLLDNEEARDTIRESHPEVCFWAFHGEPMEYSKTSDSANAFWERVKVLREVERDVYDHLWEAGSSGIEGSASNDDLLDAFALALTARGSEEQLRTLPEDVEEDEEGLPMEMVYRPETKDPLRMNE